jgi:CRISPR-associated endonuclease/helicase Cas3
MTQGASRSYFALIERTGRDATTDQEVSSFTGVEVSLNSHLNGVGDLAEAFARQCALPDAVVDAIAIAGRWHDIGKADPRFQVLLHGGDRFKAALAPGPLAKSAIPPADRAARLRARQRSGYPPGYRHELMSTALMLLDPAALKASADIDLDLVLHLVAAHHGWCRPLAPVVVDPLPVEVEFAGGTSRLRASSAHGLERLDSGVSDRFFRLVRRYGWFGLAWLEAILRLADHRRSAREQQAGVEEGR